MKRLLLSLCVITSLASARSLADDPPKQETKDPPRTALAAWDTAKSAKEPLADQTVQDKNGWKPIAADETPNAFQGDAAIANGRVLALARKHGNGVELYSLGQGKPIFRARLLLAPGTSIERIALTENSRASLSFGRFSVHCAEATFRIYRRTPFARLLDMVLDLRTRCALDSIYKCPVKLKRQNFFSGRVHVLCRWPGSS